jgi:hypothetical protein
MSSTLSRPLSQPPRGAADGKSIPHLRRPARAYLAALWITGALDLRAPTQIQAAALFGVSRAAVRVALDRFAPRRTYRQRQHPSPRVENRPDIRARPAGSLSVDELLTLAAAIEAASITAKNGAAAHP